MKIIINTNRNNLLEALQKASKALPRKITGVNAHYLLVLDERGTQATIIASGEYIQTEITIGISHNGGKYAFCIDYSIEKILKTIPEQPITIEADMQNNSVLITLMHANGTITIPGYNTSDYITMEQAKGDKYTFLSRPFTEGIEKTKDIPVNDDLRPSLSAVYIELMVDKTIFVGSCMHGLVAYTDHRLQNKEPSDILIPLNAINVLYPLISSIDEEITIVTDANKTTFFVGENIAVTYINIQQKYCNYKSIIPSNEEYIVTSSNFLNSIKRMISVMDDSESALEYHASGNILKLYSRNLSMKNNNQCQEIIKCDASKPITAGFTTGILQKILEIMPENIKITFIDNLRPAKITPLVQEKDKEILAVLALFNLDNP